MIIISLIVVKGGVNNNYRITWLYYLFLYWLSHEILVNNNFLSLTRRELIVIIKLVN